MVSAVKVGGRRLHQLARQGVEVERAARQVNVASFDVDAFASDGGRRPADGSDGPVAGRCGVECSSGTYVRVLAADLGAALGGGAHLRRLRRTAVGPWSRPWPTPLEALSVADVLPPAASLPWLDSVVVDDGRGREVENGRVLERAGFGGGGRRTLAGDRPERRPARGLPGAWPAR